MEPKQPENEPEPPREEDGESEVVRRFKAEQARRAAEQRARQEDADHKREAEERERREQERVIDEALQIRRRDEDARRQGEEERQQQEEARLREEELARAREESERISREAQEAALKDARAKESAAELRQQMAARSRTTEPRRAAPRSRRTVTIVFLLFAAALVTVHFVPFDGSSFERAATARFGTPVKIGSTRFSTLPLPALRFERVAIGPQGEVKIAAVKVKAGLRTLLGEKKHFALVELEGATIPVTWLGAGIWGTGHADALRVERVIARGATIQAPGLELPPLDVDARLHVGAGLHSLSAQTAERTQTFSIAMTDGTAAVQLSGKPFRLPFAGMVQFDDFAGTGTLTPTELNLTKFEASALDGSLSGNARLRWGAAWSLEGEFIARSMNPARVGGKLVPTGRLDGQGTFSLRAPTPDKLQDAARLDASFTVQRGTLGFIDLARHLQGSTARGGSTSFERMDGNASLSGGHVQLRRIRLDAGLLNATGEAVVDPQKNLNARFQVDVTSARGPLSLGGTVAAPQVKR